ncbi:hypothetical protein LINPERHAP2_LOCUS22344 [Linum perenne]
MLQSRRADHRTIQSMAKPLALIPRRPAQSQNKSQVLFHRIGRFPEIPRRDDEEVQSRQTAADGSSQALY